jgi:hypothetical protein
MRAAHNSDTFQLLTLTARRGGHRRATCRRGPTRSAWLSAARNMVTEKQVQQLVAELAVSLVPALISATVPWRCPACQLPIRHNELEAMPRPGQRYRCHVCRLELMMDPIAGRLTVPVIEADPPRAIAPDTPRKRSRSK